jgi:hypothetical protein
MRYIILAIIGISVILLLLVKRKAETVYRTDGNVMYFESGNYAVLADANERTKYNPLALKYYAKFTYDNKLLEQGIVDHDGTFIPDNDPVENGHFFFFTTLLVSLTAYMLLYSKGDIVAARDWLNARNDMAITAMDSKKQQALLAGNMRCERCNHAPDFAITKEERVQGMIFVEGSCNLCSEQKKIRLR